MGNVYDKFNLKSNYISYVRGKSNFRHTFTLCFDKENEFSMDVCEFSFEQFTELVTYLLNEKEKTVDTLVTFISNLNNYLDYCSNHAKSALNRDIIEKSINQECKQSVKNWLISLTDGLDYSQNFVHIEDLLKIEALINSGNNELFTYQDLAVYWLLFIGFKKEEIVNLRAKDALYWKNIYRRGIILSQLLEEKITSILNLAIKEEGLIKHSRSGNSFIATYKNHEYLIRSTKSINSPVSDTLLYGKFEKLEKHFGKSILKENNIRKSGMMYFGSEILKSNLITSFYALRELAYEPICLTYGEDYVSYRTTLDKIFNNIALKKFYDYELPENLIHIKILKNELQNIANSKPKLPLRRQKSDKKIWEEHQINGESGEYLVLNHLIQNGNYTDVYLVKDCYGYDIYFENDKEFRYIEVKTMRNKKCRINITKNEYMKANNKEFENFYWFYILVFDNNSDNQHPELYIFKDLLGLIGLKNKTDIIFKKENTSYDQETMWTYRDFSLQLSENVFSKCDVYEFIDRSKLTLSATHLHL